ncbi:MAG: transposase [Solirubrobacteraceae bacterium]
MQLALDPEYPGCRRLRRRPRSVAIQRRPPRIPDGRCRPAASLRHVPGSPRRQLLRSRVKTSKTTGARHLPFHAFAANAAWFELAMTGHDAMVWTQQLTLDGEHPACEPKRLRYHILHVAGQITRHARHATLHLPADWPWAAAILRASKRLQALPAPG